MKRQCHVLLFVAISVALAVQIADAQIIRSPITAPTAPGADMTYPKVLIEISPFFAGPAVNTDRVDPHVGLMVTGGYNFLRMRMICIGVDGRIGAGFPIEIDEGTSTGTWTCISVGLPMRFGSRVSFFLRPALEFAILDHYQYGYEGTGKWETDIDSSPGLGFNIGLGLNINIARRFAIGFNFNTALMFISHEGDKYWNDSWDFSFDGWLTIYGNLSFIIRL
jgi:hypothetical protein